MTALLQDDLAVQATRDGNAVALVLGPDRITYADLEALSNRVARTLAAAGCAYGDRVCLLAPKTPITIAAMLGVLKAGCSYVPLDTVSPVRRTARIVRAVEPAALLTLGAPAATVDEVLAAAGLVSVSVGALDVEARDMAPLGLAFGPEEIDGQPDGRPPCSARPADAAQILFTSGSTGEPKGVIVTHASVTGFLDWAVPYFGIAAGDRLSSLPPLYFDLSTFDVFGALRAGATLHLVPERTVLPGQLADFIADAELAQWFCVPSTMTYMAKFGAFPPGGFPSLRRVLWCGEVLPTPILRQWMEHVPGATFTNLYGPTEAAIASSFHTVAEVPADDAPVPIGRACAGEELVVLGADGAPAPVDEVGELYIGGVGLSPGYWHDPARTRQAFIADPRPGAAGGRLYRTGDLVHVDADGVHHFHGRVDSQIKSRGYRIELGEIEAAIGRIPAIAESAVVAIASDGFEGSSICCAFVPVAGCEVDAIGLRSALTASLPAYMLPAHWQPMDALPKNVNGKIDRREVTELFERATAEVGCRA